MVFDFERFQRQIEAPVVEGIARGGLDGGQPVTLATGLDLPSAPVADADYVYVAVEFAIVRIPKDGGLMATLSHQAKLPRAVAVDGSFL